MNPDGTRADTVNQGDIIHIFDADHPYEGNHDKACVKYLEEDTVNKKVRLDLAQISDCTTNYQLSYNYKTDHDLSDSDPHKDVWDFTSGKSAGVCVDDNQFYKADPSDLRQPFSDGFVTFEVSANGIAGSGVVPYLPEQFFNSAIENRYRFQQLWFENKTPDQSDPLYLNQPSNYWHLIGASYKSQTSGVSMEAANACYVFLETIESECKFLNPARDCITEEKANFIREATNHEIGHPEK